MWGRVGYEMALTPWLLAGVTVEGDFDDHLVVAPLVEAASPLLLVLPSASIGLGAPVMVRPGGVHAGVRVQLAWSFPVLSIVASLDVYPGLAEADPDFFQVFVMAQLSM